MDAMLLIAGALELLRDMMSQGVPFNKDTYMLACATCYKLVGMQWIKKRIAILTSAHESIN